MLDKKEYAIGEKINGKFQVTHGEHVWEGPTEAKIFLEAKGIEKTEVLEKVITKRTDPRTGRSTEQETYITRSQSDIFFRRSLSSQVQSVGSPSSDGHVKIDTGTKEAPFAITLDADRELFESYDGKSIKITYTLTGVVDKKDFWSGSDAKEEVTFKVVKKPIVIGQPNKVNVSSKNELMTLNLEAERDRYARGEVLKGKVTLNNPSHKNINAVEVGIRSIEKALADGETRHTDIGQYIQPLNGNWNNGDSRTFDLKIPAESTPTFQAKNSQFRWELVARADTSSNFVEDLFAVGEIMVM